MANAISNYAHKWRRRLRGQDQKWRDSISGDRLSTFLQHAPGESSFNRYWREMKQEEHVDGYGVWDGQGTMSRTRYTMSVEPQSRKPCRRGMTGSEAAADLSDLEEQTFWGLGTLTAAIYVHDRRVNVEAASRCSLDADVEADTATYKLVGDVGVHAPGRVEAIMTALDTGDMNALA